MQLDRSLPRGVRLSNPGNIEKGEQWQGLHPDQTQDNRFARFISPEYGIRALHKVLQTYQNKHNLKTVGGMINRWAPPVENNTGSYVNAVASHVGVQPYENVNIMNPEIAFKMVEAIIHHENGQQPYDRSTICKGLEMAGVVFPDQVGSTEDSQSSEPSSSTQPSSQPSSTGGLLAWLMRMLSQLLQRR